MIDSYTSSVNDCLLLDLPKIHNPAGNITPLNGEKDIPFAIERIYYLYDVPGGESRGGGRGGDRRSDGPSFPGKKKFGAPRESSRGDERPKFGKKKK